MQTLNTATMPTLGQRKPVIMRLLEKDTGGKITLSLLLLLALYVSIAHLFIPSDSLFHVSAYGVTLLGKYLSFALLALALDLVWGYLGVLSLGHGAFFSLGGYVMGMYLMRQIGERGVYGNAELPDFMVFLNWTELPWYWMGFDQFWFTLIMIALVPGIYVRVAARLWLSSAS